MTSLEREWFGQKFGLVPYVTSMHAPVGGELAWEFEYWWYCDSPEAEDLLDEWGEVCWPTGSEQRGDFGGRDW